MDKQHEGMVGDCQQQEENHGGGAGHKQGDPRAKHIPKAWHTEKLVVSGSFLIAVLLVPGFLPSKHGAAKQLDQTHCGLQIAKPQGVEAQFLGHILQETQGRGHSGFSATTRQAAC